MVITCVARITRGVAESVSVLKNGELLQGNSPFDVQNIIYI